MIVIPAIDLKNGKCVRLLQGQADQETVYSSDPAAMARSFEEAGAKRLHVVDLDGAFRGESGNLRSIEAIVKAVSIPIQLGGGIRSVEDIERMLELGIRAVIVGTMAVKDPEVLQAALQDYPGEQIILGIDSRQGKVAVQGWQEGTELEDVQFGQHWKNYGVQRIIFTDIARDGMLSGPNLAALEAFAQGTRLKITASGGVSSLQDLQQLKTLEAQGVDHVIVGKAIYEGKISLKEAFAC